MKLNESETVWMPENQPEYLLVLPQGRQSPKDQEAYLLNSVVLLKRLIADSNDREIAEANRRLQEELPQEMLVWLPSGDLENEETPKALLLNPMSEGTPAHEWKVGIESALQAPLAPPNQARSEAEGLTLESFLSRLL